MNNRKGISIILYRIVFMVLVGTVSWGALPAKAAPVLISNVRAEQRAGTGTVDIYYDLGGEADEYRVSIEVSRDGGETYDESAVSLSGAIGLGVQPGVNRHIVWDAGADWVSEKFEAVRVRLTVDSGQPGGGGPVPEGMALIPAGSFEMGDSFDEGRGRELPVHTVDVSAFYMDRTEVTKALWDEVRDWAVNNGYTDLRSGDGKGADHPVHSVSWYDVVKWCNARSEKEGRTPAYYTSAGQTTVYRTGEVDVENEWVKWDAGYRLPTEAEWEKAARGGLERRRFPWGDTITHSQANYESDADYDYDISPTRGYHPDYETGDWPYTSPAGSFEPNGYGLYDMAGNVWEWCWDWWDSDYYGSSPGSDPRGPDSGSNRVLRGGGWYFLAIFCRVSLRYFNWPDCRFNFFFGFRSALPPGQP